MKPRYLHEFFGCKMGPLSKERLRERGLKRLVDLEK